MGKRLELLLLFIILLLIRAPQVSAQTALTWLEALNNQAIILAEFNGTGAFGAHPLLNLSVINRSTEELAVRIEPGDIIYPAEPGTCAIVLAGLQDSIILPVSETPFHLELDGYCLDIPENGVLSNPGPEITYLPLNYGGRAAVSVLDILMRARQRELGNDYATQLAIWQAQTDQSLEELAAQIGANPDLYRDKVAYLMGGSELPLMNPPQNTATAETVSPEGPVTATATPAAPALVLAGVNITPVQLLFFAGGTLLFLMLLGLFLRQSRGNSSRGVPVSRRPSVAKTPAPPNPDPQLATPAPVPQVRCYICGEIGHTSAECPRNKPRIGLAPSRSNPTIPTLGGNGAPDGVRGDLPAPPVAGVVSNSMPPVSPYGANTGHSRNQPPLESTISVSTATTRRYKTEPVFNQGASVGSDETIADSTGYIYRLFVDGVQQIDMPDGGGLLARESFKRNVITLKRGSVSTPHALLKIQDGLATLKDLRSLNGTFVNGQRIDSETELRDRSVIRFGSDLEYIVDLKWRVLRAKDKKVPDQSFAGDDLWLITRTSHNLHSLALPDQPQLSNPHLLIRPHRRETPLTIELRDLGSSNDTLIGEKGISLRDKHTFIADGLIKFRIGTVSYTLEARPADRRDLPPQIGKHRILGQIYRGEMASIFTTQDAKVVKIPNLQSSYSKEIVLEGIRREIEIAGQGFKHEHLLLAEETGHDDTQQLPYLVLPYIDGGDLEQCLRHLRENGGERNLSLIQIKALFGALFGGLNALHKQRWVHCDLKPSNVMLDATGQVYLIDFGSATRPGEPGVSGTMGYSAPEVLQKGRSVDQRADVFSLGRLLFEVLTGKEPPQLDFSVPFPSGQDQTRSDNVLADVQARTLASIPPNLKEFGDIILKATAIRVDARYDNIPAMQSDLERVFAGPTAQALLAQSTDDLAALVTQCTQTRDQN